MSLRTMQLWVYANWPYAGLAAALFLLAILPLLWNSWNAALLIVFLQLPIYMFHQVEEHYHDRFRLFVNEHMAGGRNALTTGAVVVINVGGVWAVDLIALYLARFVRPGLGLIAMYLAIVNAIAHIGGAIVLRVYNPGLVTAILFLLPAGSLGWWMLVHDRQCSPFDHAWGLGIAIVIHAAIILLVRFRTRKPEPTKVLI
jgi:hypothetical protein